MAVTINASTSAGLVQTADTSGVLALQTAGTTAVSVSSGQVVTLTNALPAASGGTGLTSPGANNNVLTSDGTSWVSSAPAGGGFSNMVVLTSTNASYSIPATKIKVTLVAGGGGSGSTRNSNDSDGISGGGGGAGAAVQVFSGLTIGNTLNITVGAGGIAGAAGAANSGGTGGTSSVASGTQSITTVSATGGAGSAAADGAIGAGGSGGIGSGGLLNIKGSVGFQGVFASNGPFNFSIGGNSFLGGNAPTSTAGSQFGGGAGGVNTSSGSFIAGRAGAAGVVIVEY